jgi:hypothetical protein
MNTVAAAQVNRIPGDESAGILATRDWVLAGPIDRLVRAGVSGSSSRATASF